MDVRNTPVVSTPVQGKAHAAAQQQLRAELQEELKTATAAAAAEHAASLEADLDTRAAKVHQENQHLKTELVVHTEVRISAVIHASNRIEHAPILPQMYRISESHMPARDSTFRSGWRH